jgi:hypothetical protein
MTNQGLLDMGNQQDCTIARSIRNENERIQSTLQGSSARAHPTDRPHKARFPMVSVQRVNEWTNTSPASISQDEDAPIIGSNDQDGEPTSFKDNQDPNNKQNGGE